MQKITVLELSDLLKQVQNDHVKKYSAKQIEMISEMLSPLSLDEAKLVVKNLTARKLGLPTPEAFKLEAQAVVRKRWREQRMQEILEPSEPVKEYVRTCYRCGLTAEDAALRAVAGGFVFISVSDAENVLAFCDCQRGGQMKDLEIERLGHQVHYRIDEKSESRVLKFTYPEKKGWELLQWWSLTRERSEKYWSEKRKGGAGA